jgi:phage repressor protein C with HTH and peptisase S24 domain
MKNHLANENKYGYIEIKEGNKIVKLLQYESDIKWFYEQLNKDEFYMINNGFEINITNNELLEILDN